MTAPFDGRVALVTGAGRGIGRAVVIRLAARGTQVPLLARSVDQLEETAASVRAEGGTAVVIPADLAEPDAVSDAAARVAKQAGVVDVLINNAAVVQRAGPTIGADPGAWNRAFAVNVAAPIQLSLTFLPSMLERRWGRIVRVSIGIVERPGAMVGLNAYAATKAALEAHTQNLAAELTGSGVTVNVYVPARSGRPRGRGSAASHPSKSGPPSTTTSRLPTNAVHSSPQASRPASLEGGLPIRAPARFGPPMPDHHFRNERRLA